MSYQQLLYSVAALAIVMVFSLAFRGNMIASNQKVFLNEIGTQLTGVAYDVLDDIGRKDLAFDRNTNESLLTPPINYPLINGCSENTSPGSINWGCSNCGGCTDAFYDGCQDIDDFHGFSGADTVRGILYEFDISVQYVSETDPDDNAVGVTCHKEVTVDVVAPWFPVGNDTLRTSLSRVFTYDRITSP